MFKNKMFDVSLHCPVIDDYSYVINYTTSGKIARIVRSARNHYLDVGGNRNLNYLTIVKIYIMIKIANTNLMVSYQLHQTEYNDKCVIWLKQN